MKKPIFTPARITVAAAVSGMALIGLAGLADSPASAQTAAKVESQTRPNFGILLDPPTRTRARPQRRWSYGDHRRRWDHGYGRGPGYPPPPVASEQVVLIDCGGNPGSGGLENAVARVAPGGTLIIRGRAGACVGWLNIDKPMTIMGDAGFDRRDWDRSPPATIQAPDGLPCMTVAQGVRVEVRDIVFESRNAGEAACVVGYGAQLIFDRTGFRHGGDEPAIYADGGALDIRNSVIEAHTIAPAIVADGAGVSAYEVDITHAQAGMELIPGAGQTARLTRVSMKGTEAPNNFGPRSIGLMVRSGRDYGRVIVEGSRICGYVEGVAVEGASVEVRDSRICRADKGVVLYNGELVLTDSRIRAETVGVAAVFGRAVITDNVFAGVQHMIYDDPRVSVEASGNRVWSRHNVCQPRFQPRYRDRHAFYPANGPSWQCQYDPYPRDWWAQDDGWWGSPYDDYAYRVDGLDRYNQGYGWYDRNGRYTYDDRYVGEARWSRGRRGLW